MDTFSTTAMNESLKHALIQNTQPQSRYGHIIDERKDPRRRKQEGVTKDSNTLPIRSGSSVLEPHLFPDRTFQEEVLSADPLGKPALSVKIAQQAIRSGSIFRKLEEPKQQIGETSPTDDDALSSESHNSLPYVRPSGRMTSEERRVPLWSVSPERYQELFQRAQSFHSIEKGKAKQPISYDIKKAVRAASQRALNQVPREHHNNQEGFFAAVQSITRILPTSTTSSSMRANLPKMNGLRRSLQVVDTVSRSLEDGKGGVEYVKGVGVMRLEAEDAGIEQQPAHRLHKNDQTNNNLTLEPSEERSFTIQHITTEYMDFEDVEVRWTAQANAFAWHKDQETLKELQAITAQSIQGVLYQAEGQCFHLCLRVSDTPGLRYSFNELLLIMTGPPLDFMMLESLFEASIGAMKVNMVDQTYFIEKARQFQHLRELVRPSGSIIVDPLVGKSGTDLPKLPEEGLDAAGDDASDSEPATKIDVELESISEIEAASDVEITSDILIAREVSAHETASTPDAAADALFTPNLLYNSGEAVTLGDLVIRVRIEEEIKNGINKLNKLDVYDGPWVVSELPFSGATTSGGLFEDDGNDIDTVTPTTLLDGMLPPEGKHKLMHEMQQKLVKLDFPNTSKAEPWTKLVRLRPVYGLHTGAASKDARNAYQQLRESNESTIVNVNTSDIDFDSDDPTGVARIQEEAYVFLQYITFEPVGEDTFEVEKVRGKNLWRYPMEDCEDSVTDCTDPMILRYLGREGGYVKEDEVLMVKYLVRWAGWPSEDDTWEVGHGNIPQNLLEEYDTNVGDIEEEGLLVTKAITDMTRDFKSTGRIQKKPKTTSMRNKKRKSAAEGPVVTNFDSEDAKHETKNKSKRRASVPLVKATQRPKTD